MKNKYEKGEAWVGLYWSPTWVTAKYDLTLLEEPEFDREAWEETGGSAFPPNDVFGFILRVHVLSGLVSEDVNESKEYHG